MANSEILLIKIQAKWVVYFGLNIFRSPPPHHNRFTTLLPGAPRWAGARRELFFMVQGKINGGRHTNRLAGCHCIWTKQCPSPSSPYFYRPDALPAAKPTVSKHWRPL